MAAWCTEKSLHVTETLAYVAEALKGDMSQEVREEMSARVYSALFDATKILSFSCGATWNWEDGRSTAENGLAGFANLKDAYNLSGRSAYLELQRSFLSSIRELVTGPRSPNRTLLHELLEEKRSDCRDYCYRLLDALEKVTMGQTTWQRFQEEALRELNRLEEGLSEEEERLRKLQQGR